MAHSGLGTWFYLRMYGLLAGIPALALGACAVLWRLSRRQTDADRAQLVRIGILSMTSSILACLVALGIGSLPPSRMRLFPVLTLPLLLLMGALSACVGLLLTVWNGRTAVRVGAILLGLFALALPLLFGLGLFAAPG